MFERGHFYSRLEINKVLGGSVRAFMPTLMGKVVCVCITLKLNPEAPGVILCGVLPGTRRAGTLLVSQTESVPVFFKRKPGRWEYLGHYVVEGSSISPQDINKYEEKAKRKLSRIIFMKAV